MERNDLMKAVHVELPDEGCHVGVFVVVGQEGAGELGLVTDSEGAAVFCPANILVYEMTFLQ